MIVQIYFYKNCTIKQILKIQEHNKFRHKKDETDLEPLIDQQKNSEDKIKKIGPENISGFVGETMLEV